MNQVLKPIHVFAVVFLMLAGTFSYATVPFTPPKRTYGPAFLNVKDKGARGDGVHNDTAAIQATIDALPANGGTVLIPEGVYMVDAVKNIRLRSYTRLKFTQGTTLKVIPNSAERHYAINISNVHDVTIGGNGGQIVGERDRHKGTTGEWGFGVAIRGAQRVTVRDLKVSKMWGDGFQVSKSDKIMAKDIVLSNVVADQNRRQGLSVGGVENLKVYNSRFMNTIGTPPQYGIDVEPDSGGTNGISIVGCEFLNNKGGGIQLYKRSANTTITDNLIDSNSGPGILAIQSTGGTIVRNLIQHNGLHGLEIHASSTKFSVHDNRFKNNYLRNRTRNDYDGTWVPYTGVLKISAVTPHLDVRDELVPQNSVKLNYYQK